MTIDKPLRFLSGAVMLLYALMLNSALAGGQNQDDALDIALNYLNQHRHTLGLTEKDLSNAIVKDEYVSQHNGVTHIYLRQQHKGIEVFNGDISINVASDGRVLNVNNGFVRGLSKAVKSTTPSISASQAVGSAAGHLGLKMTGALTVQENLGGAANAVMLTDGGISRDYIPAKLVYQQAGSLGVHLAWNVGLRLNNGNNWWQVRVDARTGRVLSKNDWIVNDNDYRVFPVPFVSPEDTGVSHDLINAPADATASPFGWHDTDGAAGAEFTDTRGNNVSAQEDADANNSGGFRPDGGANLIFDFPWDAALEPTGGTNQEAAIVNLFYWNNIIHDVFYHYGFDEVSGNFQQNNYGNGGLGNDPVQADAQDGSGMNNANFGTPPDGQAPRMQMFLWDLTTPGRDGDFENGIITHEYGHGISNRLVGGPSNVDCLWNDEQMGEGWSDWLALILTTKATDTGTTARGMGPYVLGQPNDGPGIRPARYTTDMLENGYTYGDIGGLMIPHHVGFVWATVLWEMQWALIDQYGFDPDLYNGDGGNNEAIQLVMDGMKFTACNPGFVDGRDAILLADQVNNNGANQCLIWEAFAKRGLGYSANQGSSSSTTDGTEAFDMPPECLQTLKIIKTANPSGAKAGGLLDYTLEVGNDTLGTLTGVTVTDNVPANTTYVQGSATCGGGEAGGTVTFPIGTMNSGAMTTCTFQVTVGNVSSTLFFTDDMESGADLWTVSHGSGSVDWTLDSTNPQSGSYAWFGPNVAETSDQYLAITNPVTVSGTPILRFWHHYDTETGYDGGVVEISTDGGVNWTDLGPQMTQNGYNGNIGRQAFTGNSGGYIETLVDLSSYTNQNVQIRFRMITDGSVAANGWYVDDVEIISKAAISNTACVSTNEGDSDCGSVTTPVVGPGILQFSAPNYKVAENGSVTIEVARIDGHAGVVTVDYATSDGTATAGSDYTAASGTLTWADDEFGTKTIVIPYGRTVKETKGVSLVNQQFTVGMLDDGDIEGDETINLNLNNPTGGATLGSPSTAMLTILDNDGDAHPLENGGFETGDFFGWLFGDNGLEGLMPWFVCPADSCGFWGNNSPVEGTYDALSGFDGEAGYEAYLSQEFLIPAGGSQLSFYDRIQYDGWGIPSTLPRIYEVQIRDLNGNVLEVLHHQEVMLDGQPYTDLGWVHRLFDVSPYAGQIINVSIWLLVPENFTGPADIEFDDFALVGPPPNIAVNPAVLSSTQPAGTQTTQQLEISNTGEGDLNWEIGEAPPALALKQAQMARAISASTASVGASSGEYRLVKNTKAVPASMDSSAKDAQFAPGLTVITHSADQTVEPGASIACANSSGPDDNSYLRAFDLPAFGIMGELEVSSVEVGIEYGSTPTTINLYTLDGPALEYANLTLIGSANVNILDEYLTVFNIPVMATVPAGSVLVVEFFVPNVQETGGFLFAGANNAGQSGPTYLAAPRCGLLEPTEVPMHLVMNVIGKADIPWISVAPESGTTVAGSSSPVDVFFNSTGLTIGTYTASLLINSNDPDTPVVEVPVSLEVTAGVELPANDLIIDFESDFGIYARMNNSSWSFLHNLSADSMVSGDIDGNGQDDVIVSFAGGVGIYAWMNNNGWSLVDDNSADGMVIGDLDGNGIDDLVVDWAGAGGIQAWMNNDSWASLNNNSADSMVIGDLDGNGMDDLIADFPGVGIYAWMNNGGWVFVHGLSADSMVTGDMDGSGQDDLIIDFAGDVAIYARMNNSSWAFVHGLSADSMVTGDIDGSGQDDVIIDFIGGVGIYARMNNNGWNFVHGLSADSMVTGDLDSSGQDDLIIDFAGDIGIYARMNNSSWNFVHSLSADHMATGNIDGL